MNDEVSEKNLERFNGSNRPNFEKGDATDTDTVFSRRERNKIARTPIPH